MEQKETKSDTIGVRVCLFVCGNTVPVEFDSEWEGGELGELGHEGHGQQVGLHVPLHRAVP